MQLNCVGVYVMMNKIFFACAFLVITVTTGEQVNSNACPSNETERWGVTYGDSCLMTHYNLTETKFGCFCKDQYRRDDQGKCVLEAECPPSDACGIEEKKQLRIRASDSCFYKHNKSTEIELGCICREQYKRDESGRCVPKAKCPKEKCKCEDNEIGRLGIKTSDDCDYMHQEGDAIIYGCFCKDGFRRAKNETCILEELCASDEEVTTTTIETTTAHMSTTTSKSKTIHGSTSTSKSTTPTAIEPTTTNKRASPTIGKSKTIHGSANTNKPTTVITPPTTITPLTTINKRETTIGSLDSTSINNEITTSNPKNIPKPRNSESVEDLSVLPHSMEHDSADCSSGGGDCLAEKILPFVPKHAANESTSTTVPSTTTKTTTAKPTTPKTTTATTPKTTTTTPTTPKITTATPTTPKTTKATPTTPKTTKATPTTRKTTPTTPKATQTTVKHGDDDEDHSSCETSCEVEIIKSYLHSISSELDRSDRCVGCESEDEDRLPAHEHVRKNNEPNKDAESSSDESNPIMPVSILEDEGYVKDYASDDDDGDDEDDVQNHESKKRDKETIASRNTDDLDNRMMGIALGEGTSTSDEVDKDRCLNCKKKSIFSLFTKSTSNESENPTCRRPNEEYKCSYGCEVTCGSYGKQCRTISKTCKHGCFCKRGFARNSEGTCISIGQCNLTSTTPILPRCSDPKEEYKCSYGCEPICSANSGECDRLDKCEYRCVCITGFVRGSDGKCIPSTECAKEKCSKHNEEYTCSYGCEAECATIGKLCHRRQTCRHGCVCVEDYARNSDNLCVPIHECKATSMCSKSNEEYKCNDGCEPTCPKRSESCKQSLLCKFSCVCRKNHVRNSKGHCVHVDECVEDSEVCLQPNEEYRCSYGCEARCNSSHEKCIENKTCDNGCHCKANYAKNSEGACIPKSACQKFEISTTPTTPECSNPNEELRLVCEDCPDHDEECRGKKCKQICSCIKGCIKLPDGSCILSEPAHHKKCTKPHEELKFNFGCELFCTPYGMECIDQKRFSFNCVCVSNYVRDLEGNCIPLKQCNNETSTTTTSKSIQRCSKPFETFECSYGCEPTCPPSGKACTKSRECRHGCFCVHGYARDIKGDCVRIKDCSVEGTTTPMIKDCRKVHEEFRCSYGCEPTCPPSSMCTESEECKHGCFCELGYVRDYDGDCVRSKDCTVESTTAKPVTCHKQHERFKCSYGCEPTCPSSSKPCRESEECEHGCFCEPGYVRDSGGDCIRSKDCTVESTTAKPATCHEQHESFKCSYGCEPTCPPSRNGCTKSKLCRHGCHCDHGYARNSEGDCVRISDCAQVTTTESSHATTTTTVKITEMPKCHKSNEEYRCSYGCEATCLNHEGVCHKRNTKCIKGCYCKIGFARDLSGACVPVRECDASVTVTTSVTPSTVPELELNCTRPNEHYECGSPCQTNCENYNRPCPIINVDCNKGCYCNKGYARDSTKTCIPVKDCADRQNEICGSHEEYRLDTFVYNECITTQVYSITKTYGCYCIKGYKRNSSGKCIPVKECPAIDGIKCTGDYEHYECGSACQTTCKNYNKTCPITKIHCVKGCYCNFAYARNDKGVCIPVKNCNEQSNDHCPNHEEYKLESPIKYLCVQDYSRKDFKRALACHCIDGYKRDCTGHCVPRDECPVSCKKCRENEEYRYDIDNSPKQKKCMYKVLKCHCIKEFRYDNTGKCVPDTGEICKTNEVFSFDNYNNDACATDFENPDNSVNVYGCHCIEGYKRNKSGLCIKEDECPEDIFANCTRPNEHYECGSPCQTTCGNYMKPCRIKCDACIKGCYCNNGHARDCTGTCIEIENCVLRENGICGKKEEYRLDSFISNECASNPVPSENHPLLYGCYCIKGYKRNNTGDCIPEKECNGL